MKKLTQSFTLIELLIVIVIISILAAAFIPRLKGMQNKARYARVEKDFQNFKTAVFLAQSSSGKPLKDITNYTYTAGYCTSSSPLYTYISDLRNLPPNHDCRIKFLLALQKIAIAAGMTSGALDYMELDPRGSPYQLDENEGEGGNCGKDRLRSAGPDGSIPNNNDNRTMTITPIGCPGSY